MQLNAQRAIIGYRSCAKLSLKNLKKITRDNQYWYCYKCIEVFPFFSINDDECDFLHSNINLESDQFELYKKCLDFDNEIERFKEYNACHFKMISTQIIIFITT